MMVVTEFHLSGEARSFVESSGLTDPDELATAFAKGLPDDAAEQIVGELLRAYFREVLRTERHRVLGRPKSARWEAVGGWRNTVVQVEGNYKHLGDCTVRDVAALASERREQAAQTAAMAERFDRLADLMRKRSVTTAGSLDDDEVAEIFQS